MRVCFKHTAALALLVLAGCGDADGGSSGSNSITSITITPAATQVYPGKTRSFRYTVNGTGSPNSNATWRVASGGGTVDANGLFTAPAAVGTSQVEVTSVGDPTKKATAQVQITNTGVNLDFSSRSVGVTAGGTLDLSQFVTVSGTANTGLNWSTTGVAGGTVSSAGLFTATPGAAGSTVVVVSSQADPDVKDFITVTIISVTLSINPKILPGAGVPALHVGQMLKFGFSINTSGTSNAAVTWATTDSSGSPVTNDGATIDSTGNYKAPAVAGTYYVTVRSVADPSVKDTATIQVLP